MRQRTALKIWRNEKNFKLVFALINQNFHSNSIDYLQTILPSTFGKVFYWYKEKVNNKMKRYSWKFHFNFLPLPRLLFQPFFIFFCFVLWCFVHTCINMNINWRKMKEEKSIFSCFFSARRRKNVYKLLSIYYIIPLMALMCVKIVQFVFLFQFFFLFLSFFYQFEFFWLKI